MSDLIKILERYGNWCAFDGNPTRGGANIEETVTAIIDWFDEFLGEEDMIDPNRGSSARRIVQTRNYFRQELKDRLKSQLGEK